MRNLKKSEVLEVFSKSNIEVYDYGYIKLIDMFWVYVPTITPKELSQLGNNIFDIQPRNDDYMVIRLDRIIDD